MGWMQESAIESLYHKHPINRGFLKGPYIPIYGVGGILLLFICQPFKQNPVAVYFIAMLSCTALEYFVGWMMETFFGKQFWDYSMFKLTYKNRISLVSSLFWGVMGLFVTYAVAPATQFVVIRLPHQLIVITAVVVPMLMTVDFFLTVKKELASREGRKLFTLAHIGEHIQHFNIIEHLRGRFSDDDDIFDDGDDDEQT